MPTTATASEMDSVIPKRLIEEPSRILLVQTARNDDTVCIITERGFRQASVNFQF
jgi:hypothetical protein